MNKKIISILICLLCVPVFVNAYFYTSDSQFKSDLMDTIRDDRERQQQIDTQRALDRQIEDLKRQTDRDLQSNRDAIRDWSDNVDREMYRVEKEWEREKAQKEEDKKWQNFLDKVELDKQQAILEKQKKELEGERKKLEEEKWNNTSQEVKDAIKYVDDYMAMTPEERAVEDTRKKLKSKEAIPKKAEITQQQNTSNVVPIKSPKTKPKETIEHKSSFLKSFEQTTNEPPMVQEKSIAPVVAPVKKVSTSGFFGDLENTTVTPVEKKTTKGPISYFDQLIENESPSSVAAPEQKEERAFFNKLKDRFFVLFNK